MAVRLQGLEERIGRKWELRVARRCRRASHHLHAALAFDDFRGDRRCCLGRDRNAGLFSVVAALVVDLSLIECRFDSRYYCEAV